MKKLKVNKSDIGRWVTVKWDDVGRRDCVLLNVTVYSRPKCNHATVFDLDGSMVNVTLDQIIDKRGFVMAA